MKLKLTPATPPPPVPELQVWLEEATHNLDYILLKAKLLDTVSQNLVILEMVDGTPTLTIKAIYGPVMCRNLNIFEKEHMHVRLEYPDGGYVDIPRPTSSARPTPISRPSPQSSTMAPPDNAEPTEPSVDKGMKDFKKLKPGDLVRHKHSSEAYIVHANYGDRVTAARTVDLTNPFEWDQVRPDGSVIYED